jgi:MoxR-like ATPase
VPRLFWCSAASTGGGGTLNLERSLIQGVPVAELSEWGLRAEPLLAHARDGRVRFWGTTASEANLRKWERLEAGDVGLIYTGNRRFGYWGEVWGKERSREVADHVWLPSAEPWECLIFLDPVEAVDIPVARINQALGYEDDATPRGFEILSERTQGIVELSGGPVAFIEKLAENDSVSAGSVRARPTATERPFETIPALRIGYAHRLLLELLSREPISISDLFTLVDPETLCKAEREHRAPVDRAQDLLLFARRLGLVSQEGDKFLLTEVGEEYVGAGDEDDIWEVSSRQAAILRDQLLLLYESEGVLAGAALMLSIVATAPPGRGYSNEDLGRALGQAADRSGWRSERTFVSQGSRFMMLLADMELVTDGRVNKLGEEVLLELDIPEHPSIEELLEAPRSASDRRLWWVNQGKTYEQERDLGLIWAPKLTANQRRRSDWDSLRLVRPGDVIVHYSRTNIIAVSTAQAASEDADQPRSLETGDWSRHGRQVRTDYRELAAPIPLSRIPESVRVDAGRPFDRDGGVSQGYLFRLSPQLVRELATRFPELGLLDDAAPAVDATRPREEPIVRTRSELDAATVDSRAIEWGLRLPSGTCATLVAALRSGKHVILTGPPGTAKTSLARLVGEIAAENRLADGYVLTTATADWTTYETIGGLRPTERGLEFVEGHFLAAIRKRQWLVIDELNRSNFDRAFGQLFTVLSGQPVVLPYTRPGQTGPLTLVPAGARSPVDTDDELVIPRDWRVIATMNVFDKSLLFEMSYALMRRFAFIEVASPEEDVFRVLIRAAVEDLAAAETATKLLIVRTVKDIGPAAYLDIARYDEQRRASGTVDDAALIFEAFYSYLLPQFEGIDDEQGIRLYRGVAPLLNPSLRKRLRATLTDVLGVRLPAPAPRGEESINLGEFDLEDEAVDEAERRLEDELVDGSTPTEP